MMVYFIGGPRDLSKEIISDAEPAPRIRVVLGHEPLRAPMWYAQDRRPSPEEMAHIVNHVYEFLPIFTPDGEKIGLYIYKPWSTYP